MLTLTHKWGRSCAASPHISTHGNRDVLDVGVVYKLPLRQTRELMRSIARLMGLEVPVPNFSTLSCREPRLNLPASLRTGRTEPAHLAVESTGMKIFGKGNKAQLEHLIRGKHIVVTRGGNVT
ncbi:transposase [Roseovarius sp. Pro17]|uniref:transposase n=1 Tax=Roseovarius sp. Pro17 TaxID=3108175 RepID=UPI003A7F4C28